MVALSKQRVLLVDDEPQILVALEDLLGDEFDVCTAQSGSAALELMDQDEEIAVIITDQRMPQMQGDELVARVRTLHFAERILVTGYADLGAVVRAVNDGQIFAYVTKPWNSADLQMKVSQAAKQFRLSRELAAEKRLLDDLMNNSPDGIYFKDRDLKFIRVNKTVAHWLGRDGNNLVGKKLTAVMDSPVEAERIEMAEREILLGNKPRLDWVRQDISDGSTRWFSETTAPVRSFDNSIRGLVGISRDISRQRELEQQLLQSQKMEAMGKLAGGVAHDFNNLLVVIQGYGELLRDGYSEVDLRREYTIQQLKAVDRAASLTKQLLTFSRNSPARTSLLDINELLKDVAQMLRRLLPENIVLSLDLLEGPVVLRADTTRIEQVVINLVINARDAMPEGGEIKIRTTLVQFEETPVQPLRSGVRITVADSGSGIPAEIRERIFEPFFSTKEVGKGTGLGLSTVYGIVRQLGGEIAVVSEMGRGSCFTVDLPASTEQISSATPVSAARRSTGGSETILLVEDDDDVRQITQRILESAGYRVLSAASPTEAQLMSTQFRQPIDLILTDVSMPELDGLTLAGLLTQHRPESRVLYMSGFVELESNGQQLSQEGYDYLEKPFGPERLLAVIREVLTRGRPV